MRDVIVLGAGVAGLQCARRLRAAGADLLVVDRADKPGGRCATRVFNGQHADYGTLFLHGNEPGFLAALDAVQGAQRLDGWPRRVAGLGTPCQPLAFAPGETRMAFGLGVNSFPRFLAEGIQVQMRTQVASVSTANGCVTLTDISGNSFQAKSLVLALALDQSLGLIREGPRPAVWSRATGLLSLFSSVACLTVIAGYGGGTAREVEWDICYPEEEPNLLLMSNESSKRPGARATIMVYQGSARWSRKMMDKDRQEWSKELLAAAARRLGPWAAAPEWTHAHRWRYSRLDGANELAAPFQLAVEGCRVGFAGDLFFPGGGVQAAWMSGDRLGEALSS